MVIPWRGGCAHRELALDWVWKRWPWPIVLGELNEGPWIKAHALSAGIALTDADVLILADADVWCDGVPEIVERIEDGEATWGMPHRSVVRLTGPATKALIDGADPDGLELEQPSYRAHPGGGITVIRRDAWERCPMDPRFVGWGHEDDAYALALRTMCGRRIQGHRQLIHLWHPPQERLYRSLGSYESEALFNRYHAASGKPEQMSALLDEFRSADADSRSI